MKNRREFLRDAAARVVFTGCSLMGGGRNLGAQPVSNTRRQVTVGGVRVKTIDVHAHVIVPEAVALLGGKTNPNDASVMAQPRFDRMDKWGTDMQALSINPNWY